MPSKKPVPSASKALVPVGQRSVTAKRHGAKRNENGDKPTTARALVLRNGKHGARGTGEVMLITKISGREKLDLLAEDLVEQSKKAVLEPFRLDKCVKIAESQLHAFLDEISNLRDPDLFASLVQAEFKARTPAKRRASGSDPCKDAAYIASIISTRIHNVYMLASAWKIIYESLLELQADGLEDRAAKTQLKNSANLRSRYLVLYDMVSYVVNTSQVKFSVLATTTEHYAPYFKKATTTDASDADNFVFEWASMREACKSFLDSIIIELCLPGPTYPKPILYQILHQSIEESPKEAKRFPQALWDAVGDLSVTIELLEILDRPLLGPEGEAWKQLPRHMPEQYEKWVDAQLYSTKAADMFRNFKDIIFPLDKTKKASILENLWKYIDLNYKAASGLNINTLWQLDDVLHRSPQWHSYYIPSAGGDSDSDSPLALVQSSKTKGNSQRKRLAITSGRDPYDSMPELQSVSNSSGEDSNSDSDSDSDEDDESDDESGYDTEREDELRDLRREAMDIVSEIPGFFDPKSQIGKEFDAFQEERKGNPFLKILGSLRGRMFSANPKLKTANRSQPRNAYMGTEPPPSATATKTTAPDDKIPSHLPTSPGGAQAGVKTGAPKSFKTTVEDVEDEDDEALKSPKKKKKKPKKKKKTAPSVPEEQLTPVIDGPASPRPVSPPSTNTSTAAPRAARTPAVSSLKEPAPTVPKSPTAAGRTPPINASTVSLAAPIEQTTAQSSRSYLQSENITSQKAKVKSRPGHPSLFPIAEKTKGFFSKFGQDKSKSSDDREEKKGSKYSWFSRLGKKTNGYMHQLLNTSEDDTKGQKPMKWGDFLKLMREMGFEYDPSTAGSSVRFDPPDKRDVSITFHRPHPDPTLQPKMLKEFSKKLKRTYGWSEEDFLKQTR